MWHHKYPWWVEYQLFIVLAFACTGIGLLAWCW